MDGDWSFRWDDVVSSNNGPPGMQVSAFVALRLWLLGTRSNLLCRTELGPSVAAGKPSPRKAFHRRSNSTPLEHTSSVLLNLAGDSEPRSELLHMCCTGLKTCACKTFLAWFADLTTLF